ncbi:MAG: phospholipase D-like domain-containing protein [Methanosarcinales archaeon]
MVEVDDSLEELVEKIQKVRVIIRHRDEYQHICEELSKLNNELQEQLNKFEVQYKTLEERLESVLDEKDKLLTENKSLKQQVDSIEFIVTTPSYTDEKTISDEFRLSAKDAKKEICIASPWITHLIPEIENIAKKGVKFKTITRIDTKDIGTPFFDENIARRLIELGEVKKLNSLHAKMIIVDKKKAIISSANITKSGLGNSIYETEFANYEAGLIVCGEQVKKAIDFFDSMWKVAEKIDKKELDAIIKEVSNE